MLRRGTSRGGILPGDGRILDQPEGQNSSGWSRRFERGARAVFYRRFPAGCAAFGRSVRS